MIALILLISGILCDNAQHNEGQSETTVILQAYGYFFHIIYVVYMHHMQRNKQKN